jgi:hypothetical protein
MKTIIKLLIVVAILNACARGAMAAWTYYQFKDAASQTILFGGNASTGQLQEQILRRAAELDVPIEPQNLTVTRDGPRTVAEASYTQPVELVPTYEHPVTFSFTVDALSFTTKSPPDVIQGK